MPVDSKVHELNDGHILEALDRLHVACVYIEQILGAHPLLNAVPDFKNEVNRAAEMLADLYQKLGQFDSVTEIEQAYELTGQ